MYPITEENAVKSSHSIKICLQIPTNTFYILNFMHTITYPKITIKRRAKMFIVYFVLSVLLCNCIPKPKPREGVSFYLVVAPTTTQQNDLALAFLSMVEGENSEKTRIITSGNQYRVAELCNPEQVSLLVPGLKVLEDSEEQREAVLSSAKSSLVQVRENKKTCNSNPMVLIDLMTKLGQAMQNEELVVFVQAPWSQEKLSNEVLGKLTEATSKLALTKKIKKIALFGVDPQSASKLSKAFEAFNQSGQQIFDSPAGLDTAQMSLKLEAIRSDILMNPK